MERGAAARRPARETRDALARLEARVEDFIEETRGHFARTEERFDRIEASTASTAEAARATNGRVKELELYQARVQGFVAGAGGLWHVALGAAGGAAAVAGAIALL